MDSALERVLIGLTSSQHTAVTSPATPLCVIAGAGSGKTRVLTRRVARRILDGSAEAERTLVLTFTRKAADELRKRLARLDVAPTVNAGTFHAVAYAQLRR
jgi:DNA helicase-2/ATP-dependent DNA helicase PcrA